MYDGTKIRDLRRKMGLSQKQLAERAGVTQPTISDMERQVTMDPGSETLLRVATALGVPLGKIMGAAVPKGTDLSAQMLAVFAELDDGHKEALIQAAKALLLRNK